MLNLIAIYNSTEPKVVLLDYELLGRWKRLRNVRHSHRSNLELLNVNTGFKRLRKLALASLRLAFKKNAKSE